MRILFVCSGNTCRSPLALAAWRAFAVPRLHQAAGLPPIEAISAGLAAVPGMPATSHACELADSWGASLDSHEARHLTSDLATDIDLFFTMTPDQADAIRAAFPEKADRVYLLGTFARPESQGASIARLSALLGDHEWAGVDRVDCWIFDPFGGSEEAYQACADHIRRSVEGLAQSLASGQLTIPTQ